MSDFQEAKGYKTELTGTQKEVDQRVPDALANNQIDTYLNDVDPIKALISNRGLNYVLTYLRFAKFPIRRRHHLLDNDKWFVTIC